MNIIPIVGFQLDTNPVVNLFNVLQNDVEPLPEPWRTIFLILVLLGALVIPIVTCVFSLIRRSITKRRVEELGATWEDVDGKVPKPEEAMIENIECIAILILLIFAGIVVVLMAILGPIVRDIAVIILLGFTILFVVVICPVGLIWGVRVDDRKNAERIRLAEEYRRLKETGQDMR